LVEVDHFGRPRSALPARLLPQNQGCVLRSGRIGRARCPAHAFADPTRHCLQLIPTRIPSCLCLTWIRPQEKRGHGRMGSLNHFPCLHDPDCGSQLQIPYRANEKFNLTRNPTGRPLRGREVEPTGAIPSRMSSTWPCGMQRKPNRTGQFREEAGCWAQEPSPHRL